MEIINHNHHARATTSNKNIRLLPENGVLHCCHGLLHVIFLHANIKFLSNLLANFSKMVFFYPPLHAKFATIVLIALVATGTKAKKKKI